jgi:hypothetical protein
LSSRLGAAFFCPQKIVQQPILFGSFQNLIFERYTFGVMLIKPFLYGLLVRENLEVVDVTDILTGVDVDPDGHSALHCFRFILKNSVSRAGSELKRSQAARNCHMQPAQRFQDID